MKNLRRTIMLVAVLMAAMLCGVAAYADSEADAVSGATPKTNVVIDGKAVSWTDAEPFVLDGRTMVPLRDTAEAMGLDVEWDQPSRTASFIRNYENGSDAISFSLGSSVATFQSQRGGEAVAGGNVYMDAEPLVEYDRVFAPVRYLAEYFGYAASWNAAEHEVSIKSELTLWTADARAREELMDFIATVTNEASEGYIPPEDRIAVFDLDGTLFCETDPNYFDYTLLKYRVLEDSEYKDKASEFEREVAEKIKEQNETGKSFSGLEVDHGKAVASAFKGLTLEEFNDYIQEFKKQPMPSYEGMLRGEGWYLPMLQVVNYLKDSGFTVYIVSGTDRLIVRGIADGSPLGLPNRQIIGSDELIKASGQGDTDGLNYVFKDGDELVLGGEFLIKNLKMNKVSVIMQEIGQQPVLSFGNSTGDSSMAEYVTYDNKYPSLAFMLCCDDTVRENGSEEKAEAMNALCEEYDWVPISMRDDWSTIYGDGVSKK